jgi:hypothetical protein
MKYLILLALTVFVFIIEANGQHAFPKHAMVPTPKPAVLFRNHQLALRHPRRQIQRSNTNINSTDSLNTQRKHRTATQ